MSLNSLYYALKPLIPRMLQLRLRRRLVRKKRLSFENIWPIDPKAGNPPQGWGGWPEGKRFALVLTHDVETAKGQENCYRLIELEQKFGFRSSFGFVPERYNVSSELRRYLQEHDFEVGVHGLYHDGMYFHSREVFKERAQRINQYLKEWGAVGFRTPSMYHKLEWIHDLNIAYDSSTFDTDPFEPQPDSAGTIFPFYVPRESGNDGYVELPYTLPQDFTLFIMMGETDIAIWKQKLDWIAARGGMALLLVHPDYLNFDGKRLGNEEYPATYYRQFLEYVKRKYEGQYWHALPREVAGFWEKHFAQTRGHESRWERQNIASEERHVTVPLSGRTDSVDRHDEGRRTQRRGPACFVYYARFNGSAILYREAKALKDRGFDVDLICLRDSPEHRAVQTFDGLKLYGIQARPEREKKSVTYFLRLAAFSIKCAAFLSVLGFRKRYAIIHVTTPPDVLVFSSIVPKLLGAKVVMDIHDIGPELYMRKLDVSEDSGVVKSLRLMERLSAKFADHVITVTDLWKDRLCRRSTPDSKCTVLMNVPDDTLFDFASVIKSESPDGIRIYYHGSLEEHFGVDTLIKAFPKVREAIPDASLHIYGSGRLEEDLRAAVGEQNMGDFVSFHGIVPFYDLPEVLRNADIGAVPTKGAVFSEEALSMKSLEYIALGIPIVISQTKVHDYYYDSSMVRFFRPGDPDDLANSLIALCKSKQERERLAGNALNFLDAHGWKAAKKTYLEIVERLIGDQKSKS